MSSSDQPELFQDVGDYPPHRALLLHIIEASGIPVLPERMADGAHEPIKPFTVPHSEPVTFLHPPSLKHAIRQRNLKNQIEFVLARVPDFPGKHTLHQDVLSIVFLLQTNITGRGVRL